jgi:putative flavoprotein involved in K+ transport
MFVEDRKGVGDMASRQEQHVDVAVIGGGQAGLAIGYWLARSELSSVILEAGQSVGTAWRNRWDSLVLFTPRRYDALPGLAFPGDPDGYPTRGEVVDYLEQYAREFDLQVSLESRVQSLAREDVTFTLDVGDRRVVAENVVVATGPFQLPRVPRLANGLAPEVVQMHSVDYRRPSDIPCGRALVVGGGNTGYQIAEELSATHSVTLAVGSKQTPLPQRLFGHDLFWWLTKLGLLNKSVETRVGRRARERDTLIGSSPRRMQRFGVELKPRAVEAAGRRVTFADRATQEVDAVIWATGYRPDYSWMKIPVFDSEDRVRHRRGVTGVPGLYFLGLSWQHTRGSALLGWVKDDAEFIARKIAASTTPERPEESSTTVPPAAVGASQGA